MSMNSTKMNCKKLTLFTVLAVTLQFFGLCLFIIGFFPVKPTLTGISGLESLYPPGFDPADLIHDNISSLSPLKFKSLYQELSGVPPLYDRLIFMVIDGLPAEFVLGKDGNPPSKVFKEAMPYTMSMLDEGMAIGYHAKAAPPTVTMPRLKAMVSGVIGGFLDVAFNFNTQAFLDDNLIAQFLRFGWKMVMLGDETWLKLFPGMFTRHDGVGSFFVKDTVEVDHNVSRHLANELNRTNWDLLILHYLGLDHVGHIGGRNSFLMAPKLLEMDEVIKRIHSSITTETQETRRTLLMVVSDHGMTEGGNHGGSSFEETDSLAVFVGANKFSSAPEFNNKACQVDIASTLALLFGVPIPRNNVGTVMAEVFTSLKEEQQLKILQLNSWQLLRLLQTHSIDLGCDQLSCSSKSERDDDPERFCCSYLSAVSSHESWKSRNFSRSDNEDDYNNIAAAYAHFLTTTSAWLSSRSTDKPMGHLASGIGAMVVSLFILTALFRRSDQEVNCKHKWCLDEYFVLAVILILVLSMGSSSMIEEEQYIWHFMTSSLYLILLRKSLQHFTSAISQPSRCSHYTSYHEVAYIVLVLISGRILRAWHQGGVNWSHLPDVAKYLDQAGLIYLKSLQTLSSFLVVFICLSVLFTLRLKICVIVTLMMIYLIPVSLILKQIYQDNAYTSSTTIQMIYALLGISTLSVFFTTPWLMTLQLHKIHRISSHAIYESQREILSRGFRDSMHVIGWCYLFSWCLLQLLLQQPVNAIPVALILVQIVGSFQYFSHGNVHLKNWVKVMALYYIGMEGHFGLGNTNTLATIDVAGAFMGISSHSTIISGILMFTITYASPILAILSMVMDVDDLSSFANDQNVVFSDLLQTAVGYTCLVPLVLNSILLLAYTIVLLLMQNHLFVWSVFSPKYLYVCATTACVYLGVSIVALTAAYTCMVFTIHMRWKGSR